MSDDTTSQENDAPSEELLNAPLSALSDDTPSEPAEDKPSDGADAQDKPSDDKQDDGDAKNAEATDQPKDGQAEQQPNGQPKEDRDAIARRAYQERQRNRQQVAEQLDKDYGPKSEQQLIDEGMDAQDAKLEAFRSEVAYERERTRVSELTAGMRADAVEAMNDFPVFDANSKDYDAEFTQMVQQQYQQAARLQTSDDGSIIYNAEVPLYQFYQQMANIYNRGTSRGSQQGQADMQTMLARTENPGGSSSTRSTGNESPEELLERIGDAPLF